jgi:hypothetical protein
VFEIQIGSPPHRESLVVELQIPHPESVDIPIEIYQVRGNTMIAIYPKSPDGANEPWEFPLEELLGAIKSATDRMGWAERGPGSGMSDSAPPPG